MNRKLAPTIAAQTLRALHALRCAAPGADQFAHTLDLFHLSLAIEHRTGARVRLIQHASSPRTRTLVYRIGACRVSARLCTSGALRLHCPAPIDADALRAALCAPARA